MLFMKKIIIQSKKKSRTRKLHIFLSWIIVLLFSFAYTRSLFLSLSCFGEHRRERTDEKNYIVFLLFNWFLLVTFTSINSNLQIREEKLWIDLLSSEVAEIEQYTVNESIQFDIFIKCENINFIPEK